MHTALFPPEILAIIFVLALPSDPEKVHSLRQAPHNISQACTFWRNAAISIPSLWTHLSYCTTYYGPQDIGGILQGSVCKELWLTWLPRSGTHPLRFTVRCTPKAYLDFNNAYTSNLYPFLNIMAENINRWRDIDVSTNIAQPFSIFVPTLPPSLERLVCSVGFYLYFTPSVVNVKGMNKALIGVDMAPELDRRSPTVINVPFSISTFRVRNLSLDRPEKVITVPNLKILNFAPERAQDVGAVLGSFTLPSLQSLRIRYPSDSEAEIRNISDLLRRSHASLKELKLVRINVPMPDICDLLLLAPELEVLELLSERADNVDLTVLLNFLTPKSDGSGMACPLLQDITIGYLGLAIESQVDEEAMMRMIIPRWRIVKAEGHRLRVVLGMEVRRFLTKETERELNACIAEGLDVVYRCISS